MHHEADGRSGFVSDTASSQKRYHAAFIFSAAVSRPLRIRLHQARHSCHTHQTVTNKALSNIATQITSHYTVTSQQPLHRLHSTTSLVTSLFYSHSSVATDYL